MFAPLLKNLTPSLGLIIILTANLITVPWAYASKKDLLQEITIKSKRQAADLKNKIASYLDEVSITQGSISITADIVQVFSRKNKETGLDNNTYLAKGKPAVFKQKLEDGSLITLQANEINYQPALNVITITGNALLKQAGSEVRGSKIIYNTLTEQLEAESNQNEAVTTILKPTVLKNKKRDDNND